MDVINTATLGRIEERVEGIRDDVREIKDLVMQQNSRIRTLEIKDAQSAGGWRVGGIFASVALTITGIIGGIVAKWLGS
jgi:hypothetical protein